MVEKKSLAAERFSENSWLPPWTVKEHHARYGFSAQYVSGKIVVDCASGSGVSSSIFAKSAAEHVYGFDVDKGAISSAKHKFQQKNLEFSVTNGAQLPLKDSTADVFVCLETIEHVQGDAEFIDEAWRVLRPGGILICSTPNRDVTNPGTNLGDAPWNHFHVREYNEAEFERLLKLRFEIIERFGQNPVHPFSFYCSRLIASVLGRKIAVRFNQALKCRWFLFDSGKLHQVQTSSRIMEYFVWVLRKPLHP